MELNERIASVRKAAGLTQEQLGELAGVSRQAVSKWESGQAVPDALTIAALCRELHVSADYLLLGTDPEEQPPAVPACQLPDVCPCCGRPVEGTLCPVCGYPLPTVPPRGPRYAILSTDTYGGGEKSRVKALEKYCGYSEEEAAALEKQCSTSYGTRVLLRRGLTDSAAQYQAAHLLDSCFQLVIVQDNGEEGTDALLSGDPAMKLPPPAEGNQGIGFWGVVGAVIVALLILSFL